MSTPLYVATVLGIVVLAASMVSVELGLSVAVVEIVLGITAGNLLHLLPWTGWASWPRSGRSC
jgi:hypothetical protein